MHVPFEGPGYIGDWFVERGIELKFWKMYEKTSFPLIEEVDFLLVMGGTMNIYEYEKFPYLQPEKEFIAGCIRQNKQVLGICLGAQIIADVLGQKPIPNPEKEIGWFPVKGNWHLIPETFIPFHWHGETFNLPDGAAHIASSGICRNQGFSYGNNVLALQFHLEVNPTLIEGLLRNAESDLTEGAWVQSKQEIRNGLARAGRNKVVLFAILEEFTGINADS